MVKYYNIIMLILLITLIFSSSVYAFTTNDIQRYYSLDNSNISGTTIVDLTGRLNATFILNGSRTMNNFLGKFNQGINFTYQSGANTGTIKSSAVINGNWAVNRTRNFSISFWFNSTQQALNQLIETTFFSHSVDAVDKDIINCFMWYGNFSCRYYQDSGAVDLSRRLPAYNFTNNNTFHLVVVTYEINGTANNNRTLRGYLDGIEYTSTLARAATTQNALLIGGYLNGTGSAENPNSIIDEFAVYNKTLTPSEINDIYTSLNNPFFVTQTVFFNTSYPADNINITHDQSNIINFNVSTNLTLTSNCSLYFDNVMNQSYNYSAGNDQLVNFTVEMPDGSKQWKITCFNNDIFSTPTKTINVDITNPVINWLTPANNNTLLSSVHLPYVYNLNINVTDTFLDAVNITIYSSTNSIINNSQYLLINTSYLNAIPSIYLWDYGNYTIEVCSRDSLTNSPKKDNYHGKNKTYTLEFYDSDTLNNITMTFEILNNANNPVNLDSRNVTLIKNEDGRHITFGGMADFSSVDEKIRLSYHTNTGVGFEQRFRKSGHFITNDYELYFEHQDLIDKGWTILSFNVNTTDVVLIATKSSTGRLDFDPITGGLNNLCENKTIQLTYANYWITHTNINFKNTNSLMDVYRMSMIAPNNTRYYCTVTNYGIMDCGGLDIKSYLENLINSNTSYLVNSINGNTTLLKGYISSNYSGMAVAMINNNSLIRSSIISNATVVNNSANKYCDMTKFNISGGNITGNVTINTNLNILGNLSTKVPYAVFSDNTTQAMLDVNQGQPINFSTTEDNYLINMIDRQNITVKTKGDYAFMISALGVTTVGNSHINIWWQKNGININRSNTKIELPSPNVDVDIVVPFIIDLNINDTLRMMWNSDSTSTQLKYYTNTTFIPETPSVILTINYVGLSTD